MTRTMKYLRLSAALAVVVPPLAQATKQDYSDRQPKSRSERWHRPESGQMP
ncbi:hypothetical protein [Candidatus Thiodictyon syntrophicum]|jgi:hypothetical protein|uniref:hypothetical protein n=1 Tax=Candidatus Thiodictyon syntrophicum TaxID=1166950 RepID=UPI0012FE35F7|nr:hypothetical protein [Candidatus Thiodictyon syntrophicum]